MTRRPSGRRCVRVLVGALWLAAGALQLQPFMFTRGFAEDVLGTAALSQPPPLGWAIRTAERVVAAHPAGWNWLFAGAELAIGLALITLSRGRPLLVACWASVAFGLGVWVIGEGLGGLLTGTAALSTGAPGAAALYVALTALGWPAARPLDPHLLRRTWTAVWVLGAVLVVVPAQWGARGLAAQAAMGWMMSPHWTAGAAHTLTHTLLTVSPATAAAISMLTAAGYLVIGLARPGRAVALAGIAASGACWVFGQGFGGISTGTATDVGTAPALIVVGCIVFGVSHSGERARRVVRSQGHETNRISRSGVPGGCAADLV